MDAYLCTHCCCCYCCRCCVYILKPKQFANRPGWLVCVHEYKCMREGYNMYALYLIHAEETMFIPLLLAKYKATTGGIRVVDDRQRQWIPTTPNNWEHHFVAPLVEFKSITVPKIIIMKHADRTPGCQKLLRSQNTRRHSHTHRECEIPKSIKCQVRGILCFIFSCYHNNISRGRNTRKQVASQSICSRFV